MSSGQGGSTPEPTGQPGQQGQDGVPGSTPPPQPPSYPASPPAYPVAPPSYPPAPGYGNAPASWGGTAPRPMERPVTVRAGIGAFIASLVLGLIDTVVTFTQLDDLIDRALAQARTQGQNVPGDALTHDTVRSLILVSSIVGLAIVGL